MAGPRGSAWQVVIGGCAVLAAPAVVLPGSRVATLSYLLGLVLIAVQLVVVARSPVVRQRRSWRWWIVAVACAVSGSAAWQLSGTSSLHRVLSEMALVFWALFYVPAAVAVRHMLDERALPPTVRRAIFKDVAVVTAAASVFAWHLLIRPALAGTDTADGWGVFAALCFPLGDVVLLMLAVTLLLIPGRRTVSEHLIAGGLGISLLVDLGNALLPTSAGESNRWYMPTYLLVNAMYTAALRHPSGSSTIRAVVRPESAPGMRGWRMALLGSALCGVGLSTMILPQHGWDRAPAISAMIVMIALILSRLRRAVVDLEDAERTLRHQATHDQLTGLANRTRLLADMRAAVCEAPTLFFVDLDGFKAVNDTYGHHCGDTVLKTVAERLTRVVRRSDTVARLGGDEFVIVCAGLDDTDIVPFSERIESVIAEPIDIGVGAVTIGASIGVLCLPPMSRRTAQQTEDLVSDLLNAADAAMYEAKRAGGGIRVVTHA